MKKLIFILFVFCSVNLFGQNFFWSYSGGLPTVTTANITDITESSATGGGNVASGGGASVTARGVCWSTSTNPTTANSHTTDGTGTGSFTSYLTSLVANTLYYVRAYATNNIGTAYGSNETFTTLIVYHSVVKSENFTYDGVAGGCASPGHESEPCSWWGDGTVETYTVPAGTYTSTISQADADAKAQADVDANGQDYANSNGNCIC